MPTTWFNLHSLKYHPIRQLVVSKKTKYPGSVAVKGNLRVPLTYSVEPYRLRESVAWCEITTYRCRVSVQKNTAISLLRTRVHRGITYVVTFTALCTYIAFENSTNFQPLVIFHLAAKGKRPRTASCQIVESKPHTTRIGTNTSMHYFVKILLPN